MLWSPASMRRLRWQLVPMIWTLNRLVGRRWNAFYAWMLNRQERGNSIEDIIQSSPSYTGKEKGLYDLSVAKFHLSLLQQCGVTPDSVLLDFGCGFGRSAVHLVPFLKPGHYVGVDLSSERIRLAREYVAREGLGDQHPEFHTARADNALSFLKPKSFDFVWARAVLEHMPPAEMRECLTEIHGILKDTGVFVGDIGIASEGVQKTSVKDYWVEEKIARQLVEEAGFEYDFIADWQVGIAPEHKRPDEMYRMLRLVKRNQG